MKVYFKIFCFLLFICFSRVSFSQINDSLLLENQAYDSLLSLDTDFLDILFYKYHNDVQLNNLGTYGSYSYTPITNSIYKNYTISINEVNPIREKLELLKEIKPFTNVTYINASRKEQLFSINHIQHLGDALTFAFDYKKISSPGVYINQEANNTYFDVFLAYKSKKNLYNAIFTSYINRQLVEENGGLLDKVNFENNIFSNRRTYAVNDVTSKSSKKEYHFDLNQRLNLFTLNKDSNTYSKIFIGLKSHYLIKKRIYNDADPLNLLFTDLLIDSVPVVDSIYQNKFSNQLFIGWIKNKLTTSIYGLHELNNYLQHFGLDTNYSNFYAGISAKLYSRKLITQIDAKYGLSGYRKNDIDAHLKFDYSVSKNFELGGKLSYNLNEASLRYVNYKSNHFEWDNYSFDKQSILFSSLLLKMKKIGTEFSAENKLVTNLLFFNKNANADQLSSSVSFSTFRLAKNYKVLNFHFRTAAIYQITSNEVVVPLPEFIGRQVIYYQNYLFKKALKFQFGVNISYSTEYYAFAYMQATSDFYAQKSEKIGNYPYVDVFFNANLKRAKVFLVYEHFNASWSGYNYYSTLNYPGMDRILKFGVSWNMFD